MNFRPVLLHPLRAGVEHTAVGHDTLESGQNWKFGDRPRGWSWQLYMIWFEDLKLGDGTQDSTPFTSIDLVTQEVTRDGRLLNGILTLQADENTVLRAVVQQVMEADVVI